MHVNGSNRGILELDLATVMGNDEEKSALGMVKSLDLSKNELKIVSNMQPLTALVSLDVSRNRISKLVGLPLGLTKLNVSHNQLVSIEGIAALPFLTELDISHNKLVSLGGLPRVSPLSVLNLSNNRLPSLSGLEVLGKLQILHVDNNFVCTADDIKHLHYTSTLKAVSFRGCPITELADYASVVTAIAPSVVTLDGTSLKIQLGQGQSQSVMSGQPRVAQKRGQAQGLNQSTGQQQGAQSPMKFLRDVDGSIPPPTHPPPPAPTLQRGEEPQTGVYHVAGGGGGNAATTESQQQHSQDDLSFQGVAGKAESRRLDLTEQLRHLEREHNDTLLLLQHERKECTMIHNKNRKLEQQLSEARRVMADELHQVSELREANNKLDDECQMQKARADKSARDYRYAQQKLRSEQRKRAEEIEKLSVNHEVALSQMQAQIRTNIDSTRRMVKEDQAQAKEMEALKRKVAALQSSNRSLVVEVSRLESDLSVQRRRSISPSQQHGEEDGEYYSEGERQQQRAPSHQDGGRDHSVTSGAHRHIVDYYHDEGQGLDEYYDSNPADEALSRSISRTEVTSRGGGGGGSRPTSAGSRGRKPQPRQVASEDEEHYFDSSPVHHSGRGPASKKEGSLYRERDQEARYEEDDEAAADEYTGGSEGGAYYDDDDDTAGGVPPATHRPAPQQHADVSLGSNQFAQQLKSWLLSEIKADAKITEGGGSSHNTSQSELDLEERMARQEARESRGGDEGNNAAAGAAGGFQPVPNQTTSTGRRSSTRTDNTDGSAVPVTAVPAEPLQEPMTSKYMYNAQLHSSTPEKSGAAKPAPAVAAVVSSENRHQAEQELSMPPMGKGVGGVPVRLDRKVEGDMGGTPKKEGTLYDPYPRRR